MKRIIIIFCFIGVLPLKIIGQNTLVENQAAIEKYWFYRERLKYFVVPGTGPGESLVAGIRNSLDDECDKEYLHFGDQTMYLGYYIAVLASEARLLLDDGQDATQTLNEISLALNAYYRLDIHYEHNYLYHQLNYSEWADENDCLNGFFVRSDIPVEFVENHTFQLNDNCCPKNNPYNSACAPYGTPSIVTCAEATVAGRAMSQDNAIPLLMGFAMVKKCLPGTSYADLAQSYATKIVTWIRGPYPSIFYHQAVWPWKICYPNPTNDPYLWNQECVGENNGGDAYWYAWGFMRALSFIIDQDVPVLWGYQPNSSYHISWSAHWGFEETSFMVPMLAAVGNSFDLGTSLGIFNETRHNDWHTFYLLLLIYLHDLNLNGLPASEASIISDAENQINDAPCAGPYFLYDGTYTYSSSQGGWASSQKWHKSLDFQNDGPDDAEFIGIYNGLDYMLLYNLFHLFKKSKNELMPTYLNYKNINSSGKFPYCFNYPVDDVFGDDDRPGYCFGYNSIVSDALIDITIHGAGWGINPLPPHDIIEEGCDEIGQYDPGNVTFHAGKTITLMPGFHAVHGSTFHAYIHPDRCSGEKSLMLTNTDYYTQFEEEPDYKTKAQEANVDDYLLVYPNPFTSATTIKYYIQKEGECSITISDILGKIISVLVNENQQEGEHTMLFNCSGLSHGIYYCTMISENCNKTIKLVYTE